MEFPEPVIELAIEPKTKAGQGKMGEALAKLAEEDPTFRAHTDQETGQTIIADASEGYDQHVLSCLLLHSVYKNRNSEYRSIHGRMPAYQRMGLS